MPPKEEIAWAKALIVPLHLAIATGVGGGLGYWLDGLLHTEPWLLLTGLLVGVAAGLYRVYEDFKRTI